MYALYFSLQHTAANLTSTSNAGQQPQPEASPASAAASSATTSASVTSTASNQSDTMFTNNPELEPVTAWITFWDFFVSYRSKMIKKCVLFLPRRNEEKKCVLMSKMTTFLLKPLIFIFNLY